MMSFAGADAADGEVSCGTPPVAAEMRSDPTKLRAVLCNGETVVAETVGISQGGGRPAAERLVTDTTGRLFPRLSASNAPGGWSSNAPGVSLGGWWGSGGGSGIGVGLGF